MTSKPLPVRAEQAMLFRLSGGRYIEAYSAGNALLACGYENLATSGHKIQLFDFLV
jgi:hypothetical protein